MKVGHHTLEELASRRHQTLGHYVHDLRHREGGPASRRARDGRGEEDHARQRSALRTTEDRHEVPGQDVVVRVESGCAVLCM